MTGPDSVVVFSGGLDSTTLVYDMLDDGFTPHLLSFNYGQRHKKELEYALKTSELLGLKHDIVDLGGLAHLISNSALTSHRTTGECSCGTSPMTYEGPERDCPVHGEKSEVPEGHYAEDNMKATVVPNRNMIMLSIAAGVAVNNSYRGVATGVHAGDHFVYPDCRPQFIMATNATVVLGNEGFGSIPKLEPGEHVTQFIHAPFMEKTKADIAYRAIELKVPFENTWSCYKGGEIHCGKCGTCVERLEAIDDAIASINAKHGHDHTTAEVDRTKYEDTEFWKAAIKRGA